LLSVGFFFLSSPFHADEAVVKETCVITVEFPIILGLIQVYYFWDFFYHLAVQLFVGWHSLGVLVVAVVSPFPFGGLTDFRLERSFVVWGVPFKRFISTFGKWGSEWGMTEWGFLAVRRLSPFFKILSIGAYIVVFKYCIYLNLVNLVNLVIKEGFFSKIQALFGMNVK